MNLLHRNTWRNIENGWTWQYCPLKRKPKAKGSLSGPWFVWSGQTDHPNHQHSWHGTKRSKNGWLDKYGLGRKNTVGMSARLEKTCIRASICAEEKHAILIEGSTCSRVCLRANSELSDLKTMGVGCRQAMLEWSLTLRGLVDATTPFHIRFTDWHVTFWQQLHLQQTWPNGSTPMKYYEIIIWLGRQSSITAVLPARVLPQELQAERSAAWRTSLTAASTAVVNHLTFTGYKPLHVC